MSKSWFSINNRARDQAEVAIYDEIGFFGVRAKDFIKELSALPDDQPILLKINSPGGIVADGIAIYNSLLRHRGRITVIVDGFAGSIASVIAMAGDVIRMPENAFMLIHDPVGRIEGDSSDMRELADNLDKVKSGLVSAYARKTKQERDFIERIMEAETLLSAEEAVGLRFADELEQPIQIAAKFDLSKLKDVETMRRYSASASYVKKAIDVEAVYRKWNAVAKQPLR